MKSEFLFPRSCHVNQLTFSNDHLCKRKKVHLDQSLRVAHNITLYDLNNRENCKFVYRLISKKHLSLLPINTTEALFKISGMTPFKPVLLIPCKTEYCVFKTKVDNWPYFLLVCTAKGTYVAALFHGQCAKCKTIWYPSYNIANNHDRRIFTDLSGVDDVGYI